MLVALLAAVAFLVAPVGPATAVTGADGVACEVTYTAHHYYGGFTAGITVRNTGTATIFGWTLAFPLDEGIEIVDMWNAELISPSGLITAHNASYNGVVLPGGSVKVGFRASGKAGRPPSAFTVNGVGCAIAG